MKSSSAVLELIPMNKLLLSVAAACFAFSCTPNIVTDTPDSGGELDAGSVDAGAVDAGVVDDGGVGAYPAGPYGTSVNRIVENFTFQGYFTVGSGTRVTTLSKLPAMDLQAVRNAVDSNGKHFKYLLLDISAGWCPPCNAEAQDLGLNGPKKLKIAEWAGKGGLFMTVLVEGYDESSQSAPVTADLDTWANAHATQSPLLIDPMQTLIARGISPSAFPTNLVIDLRTMKIVSAWYGLDATYQKWEAALNGSM